MKYTIKKTGNRQFQVLDSCGTIQKKGNKYFFSSKRAATDFITINNGELEGIIYWQQLTDKQKENFNNYGGVLGTCSKCGNKEILSWTLLSGDVCDSCFDENNEVF